MKSSRAVSLGSLVLLPCWLTVAACSSGDAAPPAAVGGGGDGGGAGIAAAGSGGGGAAGASPMGGGGAAAGSGVVGGATTGGSGGEATAGGGAGGLAGAGGSGGAAPSPYVLPAFTASAAKVSSNLGTRNAGHQFTVTNEGVVVRDLGIYDSNADGLKASHVVTLFSLNQLGAGAQATPVPGGSVTVPAGTVAELEAGHRFAALPEPVTLAPGNYAVVAYGLSADDLPGDGGGLPLPLTGVSDGHFDVFEFVPDASPAFPKGGDSNRHANASFRYESKVKPLRIMPLGASITNGFGGTMSGYRGPLRALLDEAKVPFQFVGSYTDNPSTLPREQQHHDGHSGYVIQAGTSGRSGILDNFGAWLGPTGSQADVFLIVVGTNDVDLNYKLSEVGTRLEAMVTELFSLQPEAHVILSQLPPIKDAATDARCVTYNQAIVATVEAQRAKGKRISTVDLHSAITTEELGDKLHPNDVGYGKIARVFFDAMEQLELY